MPSEGEVLFRTRDEILTELQDQMQLLIPDIYLGEDGNLNLLFQVFAGVLESVFLALQVTAEDSFPMTANEGALEKWGEQYGVPRKVGTKSIGILKFSGDGATVIPIGAQAAYDSGTGEDPLYFTVTEAGTIPNPGTPATLVTADAGAGGTLAAGTYEYGMTYYTAEGETEIGEESAPVAIAANRTISLANIAAGGPGTIGRRIYRRVNGGDWAMIFQYSHNTATSGSDNGLSVIGGPPPEISTAEAISLGAESEEPGEKYNVLPGTITVPTDVPDGVVSVTNQAEFTGASDPEATEDFRRRLLTAIRAPDTGSPLDIKTWAEEVEGVDTATVFENDNMGTPTNGHTTVRISGPNGAVPSAAVIDAVTAELESKDIANIIIHVGTFTAVPTAVTVTITVASGYTLPDVTPAVTIAIQDYINNLQVGETLRVAGLYAAVFGLPGVTDVVVNTPASNQATGATSKRTPGTITVN